jgi:hypothetical protein
MPPPSHCRDGFEQSILLLWITRGVAANQDAIRFARLELKHPAAQRMAFDFAAELCERVIPSPLQSDDRASRLHAHNMH